MSTTHQPRGCQYSDTRRGGCLIGGIVIKKFTNDNRVRVTRTLIRRALTTLLKQKPIERITVKELCEEAGINRGTFYGHFNDLYELRDQIEQELLDDFKEALRVFDGSFPSAVTEVTASIFHCIKDNADICEVTLGNYGDKDFMLKLVDMGKDFYLSFYTSHFKSAKPEDIEYYYAFVSSGCVGLIRHWFKNGMTTPCDELAHTVDGIMLRGVEFLGVREDG